MAGRNEELEYNPFYQLLQTKYSKSYNDAQKKCYMICIPCAVSIKHTKEISQDFIDAHILKPSPFFKGQYITSEPNNPKLFVLENNLFTAKEGFNTKFQVKVWNEEQGYNKELKPFRILIIEKPFVKVSLASHFALETQAIPSYDALYSLEPTYEECTEYLDTFPECSKVANVLKTECNVLNENYMIIKGFVADAETKIKELWVKITKMYLEEMNTSLCHDQRIQNNIHKAVESVLLGKIHNKLFPVVKQEQFFQDEIIHQKLDQLKFLPPEALGVNEQYSCRLHNPIRIINELNANKTPLDILLCMRTAFESVTQAVAMNTNTGNCGDIHLTSDDYISILLYAMTQANKLDLASIIYYVDHFHWCSPEMDQLGYSYVTFQAILHYLSTLDTEYLIKKYHDKARSIEKSKEPDYIHDIGESSLSNAPTRKNRRDLRMERITKMLDDSTKEFASASKASIPAKMAYTPPRHTGNKNSGALGDFLSSLNDDSSPSFGKQT